MRFVYAHFGLESAPFHRDGPEFTEFDETSFVIVLEKVDSLFTQGLTLHGTGT